MINLFRSIFTTGFCAVLILSCSKDKDEKTKDIEPVDPCDRIVMVSSYNYWGVASPTANLTYNDEGRITYVKGEGKNESTYTYYKDSIVLKASNINGENIGLTYYLDANGRVKGTSFFDNKFTYDKDGYLVSFRQPYTYNSQVVDYGVYTLKYENGDLVEVSTTKEYVSPKKVSFKYYDEPNQILLGYNQPLYIGSVLGDRNSFFLIAAGFFGKQSTHLYKTLAIDNSQPNGQMEYRKDAKGRIISNSSFAFEYKCP